MRDPFSSGFNLPPGCTSAAIDRAAGADECEECGRSGHDGESCPYARLEQARRHLRSEQTGAMAAVAWEAAAERAQEEIDALEASERAAGVEDVTTTERAPGAQEE